MAVKIKRIELAMPLGMGRVNCYLLEADSGFVLIDTGNSSNRNVLLQELENAGCLPGLLKLVILTHGDFDHTGNAASLRSSHDVQLAIHPADADMVEKGDMFANRKKPNRLIRALIPLFTGFGKAERFRPDVLLQDGNALTDYGIDARILSLPGHSKGSIGILAGVSDLFCGDLLENTKSPATTSLVDESETLYASVKRLGDLGNVTIYPGHGKPFKLSEMTVPAIQ